MKKIILFVFLHLFVVTISAQVKNFFGSGNAKSIIAIVLYKKGNAGYFHKTENLKQDVLYVNSIKRYYAYDKKNKKLYAETQEGNFVIELEESYAKYYKKADDIPSMNEEDIYDVVLSVNKKLEAHFEAENVKLKNSLFVKDSLEQIEKQKVKREQYRNNNSWRELKFSVPHNVQCEICRDNHNLEQVNILSLVEDTMYYSFDNPDLEILDNKMYGIHYSILPYDAQRDINFRDHIEIWNDSIASHTKMTNIQAIQQALDKIDSFKKAVKRKTPYGFIKDWGWKLNSVDGVEPYFAFYNTSDKTIKYVDFYFSLFNAVGDRCLLKYAKSYVGNIRGVGPVESFQAGSWNWDKATHYTSGDASEMKIVKVVITYMDKTTKVLTGNALIIEKK